MYVHAVGVFIAATVVVDGSNRDLSTPAPTSTLSYSCLVSPLMGW